MAKVTIITAYYNKEELTLEWLDNLDKNTPLNCEVILVNAGSKPIEHGFISKRIDLDHNESFSNSMNAGIREATGDYIIIMGNDTFPHDPNWVDILINCQKETNAMIVAPDTTRPGYKAYSHMIKDGQEYHMLPAICWLLPKSTIDKVGLFDERFLIGCYEDNDYCKRVQNEEGKIVLCNDVIVEHRLSQTMNQFNVGEVMQTNRRKFYDKWGE